MSRTQRRLRILQVSPSYAPCVGGAERLLQAVSERMVVRGHDVTVLTANGANQPEILSSGGGTLPEREIINGVVVRRFAPENKAGRALQWVMRQRGGWRLTRAAFGGGTVMLARRPHPLAFVQPLLTTPLDVVISVNWIWPAAYAAHLARRMRRFPLLSLPIFHIARQWTQEPVYPPMLAACDAVMTLTRAEQRFVEGRGARRAEVVGAGVEPARFMPRNGAAVRAAHGMENDPVVGFMGRQDPLKGVSTLIDAMRLVWAAVPNAMLLLAGQRAHRSAEVDARLEALPPEWQRRVVQLDDFSDDQGPSILDACDVIAMPSVEESFGLVYLEAWMCRKPVVGARIPSTECVIQEGVDGLLSEPMDSSDLARCLLELLSDPARCRRMGEQGHAKTLSAHTWEAVVDRWEAVVASVVNESK